MGLLLLGYIRSKPQYRQYSRDLISRRRHDELCSGGEYRLRSWQQPNLRRALPRTNFAR
jgi:hypothetical protein